MAVTGPLPVRCTTDMFLSDEVRAEATLTAAAVRLAAPATGTAVTRASLAAWAAVTAAAGPSAR